MYIKLIVWIVLIFYGVLLTMIILAFSLSALHKEMSKLDREECKCCLDKLSDYKPLENHENITLFKDQGEL